MLKISLFSSSEKLMPNAQPKTLIEDVSMLLNEVYSFQAAIKNIGGTPLRTRIRVLSDLPVEIFSVENVPGVYTARADHDDYILDESAQVFPDVLKKYGGEELLASEYVQRTFFLTINGNKHCLKPGKYSVKFIVENTVSDEILGFSELKLEVLPVKLGENDLKITRWLHYDCIAEKSGTVPFSDDFFAAAGNYIRSAAEHGHTMIYLPMFTPSLDTAVGGERRTVQAIRITMSAAGYTYDFSDFDRLVEICLKAGIRYFELSHLFTQWGAEHCPKIIVFDENARPLKLYGWTASSEGEEYFEFLKNFLPVLCGHLKELGIFENTYLHLSDEPEQKHIQRYARLCRFVKRYAPDLKTVDAMATFELAESGGVDVPVIELGGEGKFLGGEKEFWVYYACNTYKEHHSNIFLNMPLLRTRIIGIQLYLTEVKGFLHWGYNFYNSAYSLYPVDPFRETSAEGYYPAGDGFIVYPNGREVLSSLRQEAFFNGMQDYRALKALEKKIGREKTVALANSYGIGNNFTDYSTDDNNFLKMREEINRLLGETETQSINAFGENDYGSVQWVDV